MKRGSSLLLATLLIFVSVFSHVKLDVRAAVPATQNKYDFVYGRDKDKDPNTNPDMIQNIEGVYQGKEGEGGDTSGATNFAKVAPMANIFIRESDIDTDAARLSAKPQLLVKASEQSDPRIANLVPYLEINTGNNHLQFNQKQALSDHAGDEDNWRLYNNQVNHFEGDIVSFTYEEAAELEDGTKADVVFTYSDLVIATQTDCTTEQLMRYGLTYLVCCGNMIRIGGTDDLGTVVIGTETKNVIDQSSSPYNNNTHRYGISVDVKIQVVPHGGGTAPEGSFYFRAADIDVDRSQVSNGYNSFKKIYRAEQDGNNVYSESIDMTGGYKTTDGYSVYIPGWPNSSNAIPGDTDGGLGYRCRISKNGQEYRFDPKEKDGSNGDKGSFYSGFMAVVDNKEGLKLTVRSAGSSTAEVKTFLFAEYVGAPGNKTFVQAKHSTGEGGYIQTTSTGNSSGDLSDGSILNPRIITLPVGTTMTYTMTPKPGYEIDKVYIHDDSLDYTASGRTTITPTPHTDASGKPYYTYSFDNISKNKAIHVTWKRVNYTEYYDFYEEGGGTLPPEVLAVKPTRQNLYDNSDSVNAAQPTKTEVIVGNFKYVFEGWDSDDLTIAGDDVTFKGKWKKEPYTPPSGGGGGIRGGGEESSSTPPATDPVDPVTPPATPPADPATEPLPETFVPSTESDGSETTDGSSGLTVPLGEAEELTIKPVLPEGVVPGPIKKVLVAGVPLGPELYKTDGDAIILKPEYLNLLPEGTYTVRLVYENVWTQAQFAVLGARRPSSMGAVQSARTGDITYGWPVFFAITGATSAAALGGLLHRRKRMK